MVNNGNRLTIRTDTFVTKLKLLPLQSISLLKCHIRLMQLSSGSEVPDLERQVISISVSQHLWTTKALIRLTICCNTASYRSSVKSNIRQAVYIITYSFKHRRLSGTLLAPSNLNKQLHFPQ